MESILSHHIHTPPPSVIFQYFFSILPVNYAVFTWLFFVLACNLITWILIYKLLNFRPKQSFYLLLAYGSGIHFFQWDLRSLNCNIIFLTLIVFGLFFYIKHDIRLSSLFFVLSFSLKLFSLFIFPLLLVGKQFSSLLWTSIFLFLIWIIIPIICFGPEGFCTSYKNWVQQVIMVSNEDPNIKHPIRVSLNDSLNHIFGKDSIVYKPLIWSFRFLWFFQILFIVYLAFFSPDIIRNPLVFMSCVSSFLLGPISLSPYLEPYHPTPYAIPISIILSFATSSNYSWKIKTIAIFLFITASGFMLVPGGRPVRGLLINLSLLTCSFGSLGLAVFIAFCSSKKQLLTPQVFV